MTTAEYFGLARPQSPSLFGAGQFVHSTFAMVRRWCRMRQALVELRELDDRMLTDIGLCRSTLYATAREVHGFKDRGHGGF
ncbi:DUF1127 domain-containing protein [Microbaculum sp. FT89]|uniref:DUF1127 domain-containing protein n=1 Tax=Microbaculum sp. FT89 TaxID=3447298 RepID=UPI003F537F98